MILFLDFDGVLHPQLRPQDYLARFPGLPGVQPPTAGNGLFSRLPLLWRVLRDHPGIDVVFSTSWRERHDFRQLVEKATQGGGEDMAHRFVGVLPVIEIRSADDLPNIRYREILQYLREHGREAEAWLALDDDAALFPSGCPNLVLCEQGFSEKEGDALRERLKEKRYSDER